MDRMDSTEGTGRAGRVAQLLLRWLGKKARVSQVETWSDHFRMIELQGEALREVAWAAGQKIQIPVDGMRVARTYTPMAWDTARGLTRFLVYRHGDAPGSDWARTLKPGADCHVIGPRRSMELPNGRHPLVLFGDETAIGLAAAIRAAQPTRRLEVFLEVGDAEECRFVVDRLHLHPVLPSARQSDESHLATLETHLAVHAPLGQVRLAGAQ